MAAAADLPVLVRAMGQPDFFADRFDRQRRGLGELLIAWIDGAPVGNVYLWREPHPHPHVEANAPGMPGINHLEVRQTYRRRGIGTALMADAERRALEHGHTVVCLGVGVDNPARALYDGRGYDDWGHGLVEFRWNGGTETCHILMKFVDPGTPGLDTWDAWHPRQAYEVLAGCPAPWAVAGGWAIDLHHGHQTRAHDDLEVAIPRERFAAYRPSLDGFDLYEVGGGRVVRLAPGQEPVADNHQVWACEPAIPAWRMDTFLEPGDERTWVSHRDPRVTMPMGTAIRRSVEGIPYLAPEIVLFAKAKHARAKDEADLALTLNTLDTEARDWLAAALDLAHPAHAWLATIRR
jgi:GNAT superfamily N-acetyltransferase